MEGRVQWNNCFNWLIEKCTDCHPRKNDQDASGLALRLFCGPFNLTHMHQVSHRLRFLLDKIVGPHQASFMPGRQTRDNIIITQEIVHSLMNKKGKKGGFVLKIDIEKAYDRIEWAFLKKVLISFNFDPKCISLIFSCVTKGETNILWNGEKIKYFKLTKGLRHGGPLSPFLFVLYLEYLSNCINEKVSSKDWVGLKASLNGPCFSHLFFADDLILFAKAKDKYYHTNMEVLDEFCKASG